MQFHSNKKETRSKTDLLAVLAAALSYFCPPEASYVALCKPKSFLFSKWDALFPICLTIALACI